MSDTAIALPFVHVVLARPSEPRNIGATCRVMKNFGITRLTIVTADAVDYDSARPLAAWAEDVLAGARIVRSLPEAVAYDALVAGLTRRLGQKRKQRPYTPWEFAATVVERYRGATAADAPGLAIVFGNERSGLSDEELLSCHVAVAIPTSPECPSMNLSHAVGVTCYELARQAIGGGMSRTPGPGVSGVDTAAAADRIVAALARLDFHSQEGPQGMRTFLRDLIGRAGLSADESDRLEQLFAKLAGMHGRTEPTGTE